MTAANGRHVTVSWLVSHSMGSIVRCLATAEVYKGSVNSTTIRAAEVFREAVRQNCPGIIAVHNHPSGDPEPSPEDVAVTRSLAAAGKQLDISLLDHIVIGRHEWVSMKERGLGL